MNTLMRQSIRIGTEETLRQPIGVGTADAWHI
jgi:hypothetical protein